MRAIVFALLLFGLPALSHAQVTFPVSISVDLDGTEIALPGEIQMKPLSVVSYQVRARIPLYDLVRELEALASRQLRGDVRFRGLELRRWERDGLAIKVLLTLSCFKSNASVLANLSPQIEQHEISFSLASVDLNVSNDFCRLSGDALGVTQRIHGEVMSALEEVLADSFRLSSLPTPYSAMPISLVGLAFEGADRSLVVLIDGIVGARSNE
ncbi:MAG: hypothetical protein COW54_07660 [Rhodobacteraceae bacterium CG17_big_fil_post_rev_8_21_14_2_50_63_15]|nr:MAG: hypothetical protein COW54_07660 [Rhodobacteraceae bacterium CG17_big_fil_post_rev_8_21_14_2_50_63_15]